MRTWYPVEVPQFYATVTSLLLPPAEKAAWTGMKTLGQLKRERGITAPMKEDSQYKVCYVLIYKSIFMVHISCGFVCLGDIHVYTRIRNRTTWQYQ